MSKSKNRILFLLHLPPPVHGSSLVGQQIFQSQLINSTFDCCFINLLASKKLDDAGKINPYKFIGYIVVLLNLVRRIIVFRPRMCYFALSAVGVAFYKDVVLISILKLFRVPIIYHMHNKGIESYKDNPVLDFVSRRVFANSKVILLSERLYYDIKRYVPKQDIRICPNGMPDMDGVPVGVGNGRPTILFLSNLFKDKGVVELLDACGILAVKRMDFQCLFVGGEGDLSYDQFRQLVVDRDLESYVTCAGKKYGSEKNEIFRNSDLFVFPTYYAQETFGLVILEAMSSALPVISTPIGAIPDLIQNGVNGYLVEPKQSLDLADKIQDLLSNLNLARSMGKNGREIFLKNYTLSCFENRMNEILRTEIESVEK